MDVRKEITATNYIVEAKNLIAAARFYNWFYFLALTLLAFPIPTDYFDLTWWSSFFLAEIFSATYLAWLYWSNSYFDREEDCIEFQTKKNSLLLSSVKEGTLRGILLISTSLLLGFSLSLNIFKECLAVVILNILYLHPSFRWKRNYWFAAFANGIFFSFIYIMAAKIGSFRLSTQDFELATLIFVLIIFVQHIQYVEGKNLSHDRLMLREAQQGILLSLVIVVFIWQLLPHLTYLIKFLASIYLLGGGIFLLSRPSLEKCRKSLRYAGFMLGFLLLFFRSGYAIF